jgi:hypothetical protein
MVFMAATAAAAAAAADLAVALGPQEPYRMKRLPSCPVTSCNGTTSSTATANDCCAVLLTAHNGVKPNAAKRTGTEAVNAIY